MSECLKVFIGSIAFGFMLGNLFQKWLWSNPAQRHHDYTSTACFHRMHERCRLQCKFCAAKCRCECHREMSPEEKRTQSGEEPR
jgi:hypothetical protein